MADDTIPPTEDIVAAGAAAWRNKRNDQDFAGGLAIGKALDHGQRQLMFEHHLNHMVGKAWNRIATPWLQAHGFNEIDAPTRSRLQRIIDNLPGVQAWREQLSLKQRLAWCNPNTVWRRFEKWQKGEAVKQGTPPLGNRKDQAILELQSRLDASEAENRRLKAAAASAGDLFSWARDPVEEIVRVMLSSNPTKAARLFGAGMRATQPDKPAPKSRRRKEAEPTGQEEAEGGAA